MALPRAELARGAEIPKGVFHGIQNVGTEEALYLNMPTRPYDHANPDKHRLPVVNSRIPFAFERSEGG